MHGRRGREVPFFRARCKYVDVYTPCTLCRDIHVAHGPKVLHTFCYVRDHIGVVSDRYHPTSG